MGTRTPKTPDSPATHARKTGQKSEPSTPEPQVSVMSLTDAIDILEQLVDELGGREALSLVGEQQGTTGDAMAALFNASEDDDVAEGPFLGEGEDRDAAVAGSLPEITGVHEGRAGEALIAGASMDETVDFWSELDAGHHARHNAPASSSDEPHPTTDDDES